MKVALVGATGLVGQVMLDVLAEYQFNIDELLPVASERSIGKTLSWNGKRYTIISAEDAISKRPYIALFSAGATVSKVLAPKFAAVGCTVIDNSSAWRMDPNVHLVVPEINATNLTVSDKIIANPNCSTIQMVLALAPLHRKFEIKRLVISTYQSFTGTGVKAVEQYESERQGDSIHNGSKAYPHPIFENCLPHCDIFLDNRYTKEEMKLVHETRKILNDQNLAITATAVRVPVDGGHSESVNVEFGRAFNLQDVHALLNQSSGIVVQDKIEENEYPMPLMAKGSNDVYVGRIRRDESIEHGLNLWIVSDNLRKGAATNAVQIAEYLVNKNLI